MVATWSNSEISNDNESIDKDFGNLYFMALKNQKVCSNSLHSYSFDELQDAFNESVLEFETMNSKYKKNNLKMIFF